MSINKCVAAILDPFDPDAKGCALPSGSCTSSYRQSAVLRVDGVFGADGTAMVTVNPTVCSDVNCLWVTASGSTGNTSYTQQLNGAGVAAVTATAQGVTVNSSPLTSTAYQASSLPFDAVNILGSGSQSWSAPQVRGRVVCAGLKITFTGATLQDGGLVYSLVEPTHDNLSGNTTASVMSRYTSTKIQRNALRDTIDMRIFPVTRAQQEFSNAFDDCNLLLNCGVGTVYNSQLAPGVAATDSINGLVIADMQTFRGNGGAAPNGAPMIPVNTSQEGRSLMSLLYPLSRRNAGWFTVSKPYLSTNSITVAVTAETGALTFVGFTPYDWMSGCAIKIDGTATASVPYYLGYLCKDNDGLWYLHDVNGFRYTGLAIAASSFNMKYTVFEPPAYAAVQIGAGSAAAGQTFHVEYIVHVEYTGIGVQGRTQAIVPDGAALDVLHAVVDNAKENHGQSESSNLKHSIVHSFAQYAESAAPSVIGTLANALVPGSGAAVSSAANPLLHSVIQSVRKRKHL